MKDCASRELIEAIHVVLADNIYLSPSLVDDVIRDFIDHLPDIVLSSFSLLTVREREVLQLLAGGKSVKGIAAFLSISIKTAETHLHNIKDKLDIHSVPLLTKYAIRQGLTSLKP